MAAPSDGATERRVWVKVCGLTRREDAELAAELGADALGFNTWRGSKRYLDLSTAADWLRALPATVARFALTVNAALEDAQRLGTLDYVDAVQIHGDEDPAYVQAVAATGAKVIRALRVATVDDLALADQFPGEMILLDAKVQGEFGGTGHAVELELARNFREQHPERRVILAGGLKPENVARAVEAVRPFGVDVSSGVELAAGRKDAGMVRAFIEAARSV